MIALFTLTIFLAAALLFLVQPMVGKQVLPLLGGSPSVWNTVMLFFQGMLLAGYGYAHWLSGFKTLRAQLIVHAAVAASVLALLPIGLPRGEWWAFDPTGFAPGHVLLLLAAACAGPVFVLCSASPLMQSWFARSGHPASKDPYFLYAASNAGSMAALLGYPLFVEPGLTLTLQRHAWSIAFASVAALLLGCGFVVLYRGTAAVGVPDASRHSRSPADDSLPERALTMQRLLWLALAFVPAGLMMGATQHVTIDIAPVPLLWVLPLAIYLLTFILAFARGGRTIGRVSGWLLPPVVVAVAVMAITRFPAPAWALVGLHFALLFLGAMACHARLAALRPEPRRLTEFYLLLSVGGVLAGIVCGITAPALFNGIVEYPLFIVGACLLRESRQGSARARPAPFRWHARAITTTLWILAIAIVPLYVLAMAWLLSRPGPIDADRRLLFNLCWILPAAFTLLVFSNRWLYGFAVLALLAIPWVDRQIRERELLQVRTFFGVHRVIADEGAGGAQHRLLHGTTEHGRQWRTDPLDKEPMAYFTRGGPVGDVFAELDQRSGPQRIAVIGLGAGTFAAYGRENRAITFYEIDPIVRDIATDPDLFSYVSGSASPVDFVLGDARLTIARADDATYDLIAMDAFSSDAVPVHLISREALASYLAKLRPGGLLLFNVSNRHIDFEPVLSRLADDAGLVGIIRRDVNLPREVIEAGRLQSAFIVLARSPEHLGSIVSAPGWHPIAPAPDHVRLWTDDYSDILSVVKWR